MKSLLADEPYDVFLSHAGEDKREFVGFLFKELDKLRAFTCVCRLRRRFRTDFAAQRSDVAMLRAAKARAHRPQLYCNVGHGRFQEVAVARWLLSSSTRRCQRRP